MTKTKRFAAMASAMAMAVSMMAATSAMTAFASEGTEEVTVKTTVTVDKDTNRTYTAYPIFTGIVDDKQLTYPEIGVFSIDDIKAALGVSGDKTPEALVNILSTMEDNSAEAKAFAKAMAGYAAENEDGITISKDGTLLEPGYYLVLETNTKNGEEAKANILKVVGGQNVTISSKTDAPSIEKKVGEEKADFDPKYGYGSGLVYNDVADHYIGERVPFKLYGTLPENIADYKHYMYKIVDTFDKGITVDEDSIVVKIGDTVVYDSDMADFAADHGLTVSFQQSGTAAGKIIINFVDIKAYGVTKDMPVTVEYTGTLNKNAEVADSREENKVKLVYSVDTDSDNWVADTPTPTPETPTPSEPGTPGTPKGSDEENPNGEEEEDNGGDTPEDKVALYTYKLQIQKTDGINAITGAAAQAAEFTVQDSGGFYIAVGADNKVTSYKETEQVKLNLDAQGKLTIIGLDDGYYTITETKAPTGYKLPEGGVSFVVYIEGGIVTTQGWTGEDASDIYDVDRQFIDTNGSELVSNENDDTAGTFTAELANTPVGSLPETGGMGTKLFYIGGGALVLASGVVLVTRRRARKEQ